MSRVSGFKKIGPFQSIPGQSPLEIVLDQDEEAGIFDLVTSGGDHLTLTLPSGETIDSSFGGRGQISWKTAPRERIDPPDAMFGIGGFLLPDAGIHDVVMFENATKGKYQIRAEGKPAEVTTAFIPFGRMMKEATDAITAPPQAPTGQTRIQAYGLPYEAKVGDRVTATIGIVGDALSNPQFLVHLEYRQIVSQDPLQYSAPVVEAVPTTFTRNERGLYEGKIVPQTPGILRVGVQVTGNRPNGTKFSGEVVLTEMTISPAFPRFPN